MFGFAITVYCWAFVTKNSMSQLFLVPRSFLRRDIAFWVTKLFEYIPAPDFVFRFILGFRMIIGTLRGYYGDGDENVTKQ